ncbi:MAG TPA: hypothetical protein VNQ90_04780 [Chthoniobacteraceae bacterium]|nr:hypothetical protein [Chthoniobacteraceae bacterium]
MQNQYLRVSEIKTLSDQDAVNELLKEGWIILSVNALSTPSCSMLFFILGKEYGFDWDSVEDGSTRFLLRVKQGGEEQQKRIQETE